MPPRWYLYYPELAKVAAHLLVQRETGYPPHIAAGRMTQADADAGIAAMRAIAEDWAAVANGQPLPPLKVTLDDMRAAIDHAANRTAQMAAARPHDSDAAEYAELVDTLRWQQQDYYGTSRIRFFHRLTLDLRASVGHRLERAA